MPKASHETAAAQLAAARITCSPLPGLGAGAPKDEKEAYAIQAELVTRLGDGAGIPIGYKIGATSEKARAFLSCDGPFYGRIMSGGCQQSPARLAAKDFNLRLIEPEFAFTLGTALPPRAEAYTQDEVTAAIALAFPAFEVVNSALENWNQQGVLAITADNGVHGAFVAGEAVEDWRDHDLATLEVSFVKNGEMLGTGTGANALGHPLAALTWLVNVLSINGQGLQAGEVVTTGVVTPFTTAEAGDHLQADFGVFGKISLELF